MEARPATGSESLKLESLEMTPLAPSRHYRDVLLCVYSFLGTCMQLFWEINYSELYVPGITVRHCAA